MSVDLHLHTTASDGTFTPARLVKRAVKKRVRIIAVTDHDTTAGLPEATEEARRFNVGVIPGIEINTDMGEAEAHILGYFIDTEHPGLVETLQRIRRGREQRVGAMCALLAEHGLEISEEDVRRHARGESVGRPHVAQALLARRLVAHMGEAFERWLGRGRPAYVPRTSLTPFQAIEAIREAGGVAVLAHPNLAGEAILDDLVRAGLQGLEALHPTHTADRTAHLARLAESRGLGVTGGSDFHGPQVNRQVDVGDVRFSLADLERFCGQVGRELPPIARQILAMVKA